MPQGVVIDAALSRIHARCTPQGECLIWQGAVSTSGYAKVARAGKSLYGHRVVWEIYNQTDIPEGLIVLHSCDIRLCLNPGHLSVGTSAENSRQMVERGRNTPVRALGEDARDDVLSLLAQGYSHRAVAHQFGVSAATVTNVAHGVHADVRDGDLVMERSHGWPWPGDSRIDKLRRIVDFYRSELSALDSGMREKLDAKMSGYGEDWVGLHASADPDLLATADEIYRIMGPGFEPYNIFKWTKRHPERMPKRSKGERRTLFRLGDAIDYQRALSR